MTHSLLFDSVDERQKQHQYTPLNGQGPKRRFHLAMVPA